MGGKKTNVSVMTKEQCKARLDEIALLSIGALGDDEAFAIIKERKELEKLFIELEHAEEAAAQAARLENEASNLVASIEELNRSIVPDKSDEELLALIGRRKELEAKLKAIDTGRVSRMLVSKPVSVAIEMDAAVPEFATGSAEDPVAADPVIDTEESVAESGSADREEGISVRQTPEDFGDEGIRINPLEVTGEFKQYLDGIQGHLDSLGPYLQRLPATARANKHFMLKAAETDPAYVMHYADPALKSDEDFCTRVAAMPNKRNSGNALAEMDPVGRTGKTVMAGVKQDYRNIRFALPNMEGYREMLEIAKRGALHKIQELKDGADVMLLVPKVLQKDQEFMRQVNAIASPEGDSSK